MFWLPQMKAGLLEHHISATLTLSVDKDNFVISSRTSSKIAPEQTHQPKHLKSMKDKCLRKPWILRKNNSGRTRDYIQIPGGEGQTFLQSYRDIN